MTIEHGTKPVLTWVPVSLLHVDHNYQRSADTRRSKKIISEIAANFSWPLFQPITITQREEAGYWVVDGQHRMRAALQCGIREVPAALIELQGGVEQAKAFISINQSRVIMNSLALHHAALAAGDEKALMIKRVCDTVGVEVPRYPKPAEALKVNETLSVGGIERFVRDFGEAAVIWALRQLRAAYPDIPGKLSSLHLRTMTIMFVTYQDYVINEAKLKQALADTDLEDLLDDVRSRFKHSTVGQRQRELVWMLAQEYNSHVPKAKQLPSPEKAVVAKEPAA